MINITNMTVREFSPTLMPKTSSRVSFSDINKTIVVENSTPNSDNSSWYSPDEIQVFRKSCNDLPKFSDQRKAFVSSVLEIQREHKEMGIRDPKGLRQISRVASRESMKKAIARATRILDGEEDSA